MTKKIFTVFAALLFLTACNKKPAHEPLVIHRIDIAVADSMKHDGVIERYAPGLEAIALSLGMDSLPPKVIAEKIAQSRYFPVFAPDVRRAFPELDGLELELGEALGRLNELADSLSIPRKVYAYVSPYNQSIVLTDSVMLIALNHYMGASYPGYEGFDEYIRQTKVPAMIVPDAVEALLYSRLPYNEEAYSTVLSRMLYEGAVVYVTAKMLGVEDPARALGYTPDQMRWARVNEKRVWEKLVESGLLFSTSKIDMSKLIMPAPFTSVVFPDSPGRLGRFVGYAIVSSFMEKHPDYPLKNLFTPAFFNGQNTLIEASYAP